jgi:DNA-binding GntR family transcriptional regulator
MKPRTELTVVGPSDSKATERIDGDDQIELSTRTVYATLRANILRGELDADAPISQVQLARQLGVSRTPLREALRMLQREGLIESEPNRRVRVSRMSLGEVEQLYAMRVMLETFALRVSFRSFTDADKRAVEGYLGTLEELAAKGDIDSWEGAHRTFHELLHKYAGSRITQLLAELSDHTWRYRRAYLAEPWAWTAAAGEHRAIVEGCLAGDVTDACDSLARHLARTALTVIASVDPAYDPATVREALRQVAGTAERIPVQGIQGAP